MQWLVERWLKKSKCFEPIWRTDQSGGVSVASPNKIRVTGKEWWRIKWG